MVSRSNKEARPNQTPDGGGMFNNSGYGGMMKKAFGNKTRNQAKKASAPVAPPAGAPPSGREGMMQRASRKQASMVPSPSVPSTGFAHEASAQPAPVAKQPVGRFGTASPQQTGRPQRQVGRGRMAGQGRSRR